MFEALAHARIQGTKVGGLTKMAMKSMMLPSAYTKRARNTTTFRTISNVKITRKMMNTA